MIVLQAGISNDQFLVWGERPLELRAVTVKARGRKPKTPDSPALPFAADAEHLARAVGNSHASLAVIVWLPTAQQQPIASSPLIAEPPAAGRRSDTLSLDRAGTVPDHRSGRRFALRLYRIEKHWHLAWSSAKRWHTGQPRFASPVRWWPASSSCRTWWRWKTASTPAGSRSWPGTMRNASANSRKPCPRRAGPCVLSRATSRLPRRQLRCSPPSSTRWSMPWSAPRPRRSHSSRRLFARWRRHPSTVFTINGCMRCVPTRTT